MHRVVHLFELLDGEQRASAKRASITALDCAGQCVFLGTSSGQLQKWLVAADGPEYVTRFLKQVQLSRTAPVRLLQIDPVWPRFFALCDESVTQHNTEDLSVTLTLADAHGKTLRSCHCMAVSPVHRGIHRVCVATRKMLVLFTYRIAPTDSAKVFQELQLPSPAQDLAFMNEVIWCGYTKEYGFLNCYSGISTGLYPLSGGQQPSLHLLSSEQIVLTRIGSVSSMVRVTEAEPASTPSAAFQSRETIRWSAEPKAIAFKHPYVMGLLGHQVEVYSMYEKDVIQVLTNLSGATLASTRCPKPDDIVCIAGERDVYMLVLTPVDMQLKALVDKLNIDSAFDLLRVNATGDKVVDQMWKQQTHIASGFSYLYQGQPMEAFQHFTAVEIDVREIILNFPSLLPIGYDQPGGPLHEWQSMSEGSGWPNLTCGSAERVDLRDRFHAICSRAGSDSRGVVAMARCPGCGHLQVDEQGRPGAAAFDHLDRVRCNRCNQLRHGWRAVSVDTDTGQQVLADSNVEWTMRRTEEVLLIHLGVRRAACDAVQRRCIDYARLMLYLSRNETANAHELLRGQNYCHVGDCDRALSERGLWRELALLYWGKSVDPDASLDPLECRERAAENLVRADAVRRLLSEDERQKIPRLSDPDSLSQDTHEIFSAIASKNVEYASMLIAADGDVVRHADSIGNTPLHYAVALPAETPAPGLPAATRAFGDTRKVQLIGLLLVKGANVELKNAAGVSSLDLARRDSHMTWGLLSAIHEVQLLTATAAAPPSAGGGDSLATLTPLSVPPASVQAPSSASGSPAAESCA
eukprot:TRINITY_DN3359_c3_g1_i1.p1 TRINITY_DN3359_c3_g1~~TRINITY_DN3359_c3_g1_i1.p1  ORF type:complete len:848 (+),score=253.51 TRINITY_DN3359_c3_g1_i1:128-2545(+)